MKIAFLLGNIYYPGGIAKAVSIIANYLSKKEEYNIWIINYCNDLEISNYVQENIGKVNIFNQKKCLRKGFKHSLKFIRQFLKENDIDVLISCGALYFILGATATKGVKTKAIAWEHSNYTSNTGHFGKKYNRKIGARLSDYVITLTQTDQNNYLKYVRKSNVEYIYNPVDPVLIEKEKSYQINSKKIITVGNLNSFKNYKDLLKVAREIFNESSFSDWVWDIYGEGNERKDLENIIQKYRLQDHVILKGKCGNIYDVLDKYSLYVCTSKTEGLPMALLEAKANSLPIISFDILTGPREIVDDGENGYLLKFGDIEGMADKIKYLMNTPSKRKDFSEKSNKGIEKFMLEACMRKWESTLKNVIDS